MPAPARSLYRSSTALLLTGLLVGCSPLHDLTLGVAVWPFLLGTELQADVQDSSGSIRGTEVVVCVGRVESSYDLLQTPVTGAAVDLCHAGVCRAMSPLGPGLYGTAGAAVTGLAYVPGETYTVKVTDSGETYTLAAAAAEPLPGVVSPDATPAGQAFSIPLPPAYADDYDQVITSVYDADGAMVWSDRPNTMQEWLNFAAREHTPNRIQVPGSALPDPDTAYAVAVLGVVRSRQEAERSVNLTSALSGFTTGSGFAVPLRTGP